MCNSSQHYRLTGDNQTSALEQLAQASQLPKSVIKDAAHKGAVWLSQTAGHKTHKPRRIRRLKNRVSSSQQLNFYYNPEILAQSVPEAICVQDFGDYSVWIKPRGMFSQGSKWGDFSALYRWAEIHFQQQAAKSCSSPPARQSWLVHRLDRATRGLMLLAHTKSTARYFSEQFETGQIHKRYQANVHGDFRKTMRQQPAGQFIESIECIENGLSYAIRFAVNGKPALSEVHFQSYCPKQQISRLLITLHTGRKHQIRSHLAQLGMPIIGDRLYSPATETDTDSEDLQLCAFELAWTCPLTTQQRTITLAEHQLELLSCHDD